MGSLSRGVMLLLLFATRAFADVPVTSYDCAPGTQGNGACTCPAAYSSQRDPADEGKAICVSTGAKVTGKPAANEYQTLVAQGNEAAAQMDCSKAEGLYGKAVALNPKGVEAMVGAGNCMAKQSKWSNAHAQFDRALAINPKFEAALWSKAEAYRLAYQKDDAISAYRAYLAVFPTAAKAKAALKDLGASLVVEKPSGKNVKNPKKTQDVTIAVTATGIMANGTALTSKATVTDWIGVYGKPDRTWDPKQGINKIHTWDKLGFIIYEPIATPGRASSVTFLYKPMKIDADPKVMFGGLLTVDGFTMGPDTLLSAVKTRPGATMPYDTTSVSINKTGFNVFTMSKNGPLELVELGLWKGAAAAPADNGSTTSKSGVAAADVKVEVKSAGGVIVQGVDIGGRPMLSDLKKIFGEPDRVWDTKGAVNKIHIWDSLGILVYEPVGTGKAGSLSMRYKPTEKPETSPKNMFKGRVALDTRGFYNFNTIGTIAKREKATQPYGTDSVMFDLGDVHIFTKANGVETIDVVEVSFWQKK